MPIDIVLDAMGSDKSPEPEIRGAILACRQLDVRVHLVGPEDLLRPKLREALKAKARPGFAAKKPRLPIFMVQASEWISMEDKAAQAVRSKRDSSMRVGLKMVREGRAAGFFTAGNTGAAMATAKMVLGSLAGVDRPALATVIPTVTGSLAAAGCGRERGLRSGEPGAVCGDGAHVRAECAAVARPRVGLLSIGEEDSKGNSLTRDTLPLLRGLSAV